MASRLLTACALAVVLAGGAAPACLAQSDGVTVDPGSPSGKEYAVPLQAGRANGGTSVRQDEQASQRDAAAGTERRDELFGVGIDQRPSTQAPSSTPSPAVTGAAGESRTPRDAEAKRATEPERPASASATARPSAVPADLGGIDEGGGGGGGTVALIVAGVVLVGLAGGGLGHRWAGRPAR